VSFAAHLWASTIAPVANVYEYAVLNRMADEADESGEGCIIGTPTIAADIMASERQVRRAIDTMVERGILAKGDQSRAAYIRKDRRPTVYDLMIPAARFMDLARTNKRRAEKGLEPITEQTRPEQLPPPADSLRTKRSDTGRARKKVGDSEAEQAALDAEYEAAEQDKRDGVSDSHPVTGGLSVTPSATGGLPVRHGVTTSPPRGDYQSPDPRDLDPGVDPTIKNPSPSDVDSLPRETSPSSGQNLKESEKQLLSAAVQQVVEQRSRDLGWSREAVVEAMQTALTSGCSPARVSTAIITAAADPATMYPGRIEYLLRQTAPAVVHAPEPDWARGSIKYLDSEAPRCTRHRGEPRDGCGKCKADAVAAQLDEPEPARRPEEDAGVTGAALARKVAAESRTPSGSVRQRRGSMATGSGDSGAENVGSMFADAIAS
jgi:hypothetical protein